MGKDYSGLGLGPRLVKKNSLADRPMRTTGYGFDTQFEIQQRGVTTSQFINNGFIDLSNSDNVTGTVAAGSAIVLNVSLSPNGTPPQYINFGIPYIGIFEGTSVAGTQLYPALENTAFMDKYIFESGFDIVEWDGVNSTYAVTIKNPSGTAGTVYIATQWKYTDHGKDNT